MTEYNTPAIPNNMDENTKRGGLKLLAARVMPDHAMAIAIEYQGEVVVTRMYLTEMMAYIHHNHLRKSDHPALSQRPIDDKARFRMEIFSKDYYVMSKDKFQESTYHRAIPEYCAVPAIEYKGD